MPDEMLPPAVPGVELPLYGTVARLTAEIEDLKRADHEMHERITNMAKDLGDIATTLRNARWFFGIFGTMFAGFFVWLAVTSLGNASASAEMQRRFQERISQHDTVGHPDITDSVADIRTEVRVLSATVVQSTAGLREDITDLRDAVADHNRRHTSR